MTQATASPHAQARGAPWRRTRLLCERRAAGGAQRGRARLVPQRCDCGLGRGQVRQRLPAQHAPPALTRAPCSGARVQNMAAVPAHVRTARGTSPGAHREVRGQRARVRAAMAARRSARSSLLAG